MNAQVHEAVAKLREERDRLFNLTPDMLCVADFNGSFVRVNPNWESTLGWSVEELLSRPYLDFVHPDDQKATQAEAAKLMTGGLTVSFENRYLCKDGTYKWLLWNATPLVQQQRIYAAARDITARKETERQLADTAQQLREALERAQSLARELEASVAAERAMHERLKQAQGQLVQSEKMFALGQLVAGVAHEINNPLAALFTNLAVLERDIGGLVKTLRAYEAAEQALAGRDGRIFVEARAVAEEIDAAYILANLPGLVDRTRTGLKRIEQIVKDLRDFARMGDLALHEVDLNEGIAKTLTLLRFRAGQKQVVLEFAPGTIPPVVCQPAKIHQVVANLVGNAIDACSLGGEVRVWTAARQRQLEIHVQDNGSGMPPQIRAHIFDPFFTTKPPGQGTGLGLSICHSIVTDHGGSIIVESEPGRGSHFTVILPVK